MTRRQLMACAGAAAAAGTLGLSGCLAGTHKLVCRHQRSGEVYAELDIRQGSTITHSWVHSIELSRWTDTYRFDGEALTLTSTEFEEYGAGMPMDEGDVRMEDGKVIIENIDRDFEAIRWIHSHRVDYRIGVDNNDDLIAAGELPDREPIELRPR
ncbi:MAG: DUF1850 domain-containing protein [Nesterenkonia sp.]